MSITTSTHLNFRGNARAALDFYRSVFGGEATITTYADAGMPQDSPGSDKLLFGEVQNGSGFRVMAYDIPGGAEDAPGSTGTVHRENGLTVTDRPFFISVRGDSLAEIQDYWDRLRSGGTIIEDLAASAWSPGFGMVTDSFGVTWILDVAAEHPAG